MSQEYEGTDEYAPLTCELWFDTVPEHDNPLLIALLEDAFPHVHHDADEVRITHESLIHVDAEGVPGWGMTVLRSRAPGALPSLEQTWEWDEAAEALDRAHGVLVMQERSQHWVDPTARVDAFKEVLQLVVEAMGPVALVWPHADVVSDPAQLDGSLAGIYNVRRLPSPEASDGWIVDTLGLEGLNIPDLEVHFRELAVEEMAELVAEHAEAFIRGTEFMADGDPLVVEDADGEELWFTVRYSVASAAPAERRVVALVPPPEFALGAPPVNEILGEPEV